MAAKRKVVPLSLDPGARGSLDCVITVEGKDTGKRGNGRPEKTLHRPVREFLKSSTFYFQAVTKHLKACNVCDPAEAIEGFMKSRDEKQEGQMSQTFLDFADKFVRDFRLPKGVEKRIALGCLESDIKEFAKRMEALDITDEEIASAMNRSVGVWKAGFLNKTIPAVRRATRRTDTKIKIKEGLVVIEGKRYVNFSLWPLKRLQLELAFEKDLKGLEKDARIVALTKRAATYDEGWTRREMSAEMEEMEKLIAVHSVMSL